MENEKRQDCCSPHTKKETNHVLTGAIYGLLPHTGCIAFIIASVLGVTAATAFFKPLLINPYFFYILIGLSFLFASVSIFVYLKQNSILSWHGMQKKWKYISTMYGTTIGVNLLLFMVIFPYAANIPAANAAPLTGTMISTDYLSSLKLQVDIPCPGHAPLISGELKKIDGVSSVEFEFPNYFKVSYDLSITSPEQIIKADIFNEFKAKIINN